MAPLGDEWVEEPESSSDIVRFKCQLGLNNNEMNKKQLRRFSLPLVGLTIDTIKTRAAEVFGIDDPSRCGLRVVDEEGDAITVTRTDEIVDWLPRASESSSDGVDSRSVIGTTRLIVDPEVGGTRVEAARPSQSPSMSSPSSTSSPPSVVVPSNPFALLEKAFNLLIPTFPSGSVQTVTRRAVPLLASQLVTLSLVDDNGQGGVDVRALLSAVSAHSAEFYALAFDPDHISAVEEMLRDFSDAAVNDDSGSSLVELLRRAVAWCRTSGCVSVDAVEALTMSLGMMADSQDSFESSTDTTNDDELPAEDITTSIGAPSEQAVAETVDATVQPVSHQDNDTDHPANDANQQREMFNSNISRSSNMSDEDGQALRRPDPVPFAAYAAAAAVIDAIEPSPAETLTEEEATGSAPTIASAPHLPRLELVQTVPEVCWASPGERIVQSWEVRNVGKVTVNAISVRCPRDCPVVLGDGQGVEIIVFDSEIAVGRTGILSLDIQVPDDGDNTTSRHHIYLQPFEDETGIKIGEPLPLVVNVNFDNAGVDNDEGPSELREEMQLLKELAGMGFKDVTRNRRLLRENGMDANRVALILMKDSSVENEPVIID